MLTFKQMIESRIYLRDWAGKRNCTSPGTAVSVVNIDPKDHFCYVSAAQTAHNTVSINLPPVGQCAGGFYFFQVKLIENTKHVYVLANGETTGATGNQDGDDKAMPAVDLSVTLNWALLWSSGEHWYIVNSKQGA